MYGSRYARLPSGQPILSLEYISRYLINDNNDSYKEFFMSHIYELCKNYLSHKLSKY